MLVPLADATVDTCGGKAGTLGALIRAGLPVPPGVVVPRAAYRAATRDLDLARLAAGQGFAAARRAVAATPMPPRLPDLLAHALATLGHPPVAVRSSATNEDTATASAAGRHDSFLAVRGAPAVTDAVRACWASLWSPRAAAYRSTDDTAVPEMAVIVQRHLDAGASGVMFTPDPAHPGPTVIEASWGLGPSIVEGRVTPDTYRVDARDTVARSVADKRIRLDRHEGRVAVREVPAGARNRPVLDDAAAVRLARLGRTVAALLGGAQDIEWAAVGDRIWLLQARPVTATPPPAPPAAPAPTGSLAGTPGSRGTATGPARIVRGPGDFGRVRPGDILVCRFTDPAWTPLLRIVAAVVTETGGALSHAAIVAREQGIPAVLGVPGAMDRLPDGATVTVDGATGTVRP
ncbi:PEP/pyruvate-binding domain-containing protein [Polymorphospora lycopeni]|uniref:PEP/pyruvate-binding domain-containing protein n=1 Tax=Polymorphospora lycopeni TaxID=3140240 RepID=A0ABV5CKK5_9ACTN